MRARIVVPVSGCLIALVGVLYAANPRALNRKGIELGEKKLYNAAIEEFVQATKAYDKASAQVYHNLAFAFQSKGDIPNAVLNYEEALRRNPGQILTGENLGYLYYTTGDYVNAVRVGEHVLKIDPENQAVPKWLPDAYHKRLQQERDTELANKAKAEEEAKKKEDEKSREALRKERAERKVYATLDCMLRTGYFPRTKKFNVIDDPITYLPLGFFMRLTPLLSWEFDFAAENPYLGSNIPDTVIFTESVSALYKIKKFMLGIGINFSHYQNNIAFGKNLTLWDTKVGFLVGYDSEKYELRISYYPRLILYDGPFSTGKTYDTSVFKLDYKYRLSESFAVYALLHAYEYWVFDHPNHMSDYWGVYWFGLGVTLGKLGKTTGSMSVQFSIEYIQKIYYSDYNNPKPYHVFNGQGIFGIDAYHWATGNPFSTYQTMGSSLGLRIDEKIVRSFFLYQRFIFEMGYEKTSHYEFDFVFGFGVLY